MSEPTRQIAVIMFTDIVGYTALMGIDESKAFASLRENRELQKPIIAEFHGTLIKELGDGMLVSFKAASDAVHAAIKIQQSCRATKEFQLRIGIHLGEVVFENDDVFGDGVNIASRIQTVAEPGQIYISKSVNDNISNKTEIKTNYIRQEFLKNVKEPISIYRVLSDPGASITKGKVHHDATHTRNTAHSKVWLIAALVIIIATIAVVYTWQHKGAVDNQEKSIAVLPLSNLSADQENQFFADGLVEDMLNRLAMIESFKVISRTSSEMYRDRGTKSVRQIARELGVNYIVEGSVQRVAGKARINIQLIDAQRDDHLWAKKFDRDLEDIFKIQSEIAIQIASELNTLLTSQQTQSIQRNRTSNVAAFELYQLGRFHWNKRTVEGYKTSIDYFNKAITNDPYYGLAYAGMADTYNLMALQGHIDAKEGRDEAVSLALKALELDDRLAEAHNVLASIYTYVDMDWDRAEQEYLKALDINPNYATAHHYYSEHLSIVGRHEEAREQINKAVELDPLSFIVRFVSQKLYFHRGNFAEALAENKRCHELNDEHPWLIWFDFDINLHLKNAEAAIKSFKKVGQVERLFAPYQVDSAYQAAGLDGLLRLYLEFALSEYPRAKMYGYLGQDELAMDQLADAVNNNEPSPEFVFEYAFRNLRSHARFKAILRDMNLPTQ